MKWKRKIYETGVMIFYMETQMSIFQDTCKTYWMESSYVKQINSAPVKVL